MARDEVLESVRQAVREPFGGFSDGIALGVGPRHDHGAPFMGGGFQGEIRFRAPGVFPAFAREPEGNGCTERFFRTLEEHLFRVWHFDTLEELAEALEQFRQRYNEHWLAEHLHLPSPRQAHQALLAHEPAA